MRATANATADAKVIAPITVVEFTPLNFGSFTVSAGGTIDSDGTTTGDVVLVPGVGNSNTDATFNVGGEANFGYTRSLSTNSITLTGPGTDMTASIAIVGAAISTLDGSGADTFDVDGVLTVGAAQAPGDYTGSYDATVTYQ